MKLLLLSIFGLIGSTCLMLNLGIGQSTQADPIAWKMLNETRHTRYYFSESFAGFTCDVVINDNGKIARGIVNYDFGNGGDLQVKGLDEKETWPIELITNMIGHRRRLSFEEGDGRNPITFGPEDNSPLGRLVHLNDKRQSSYRIRDGRVSEVKRTQGDETFTIRILEEFDTGGGKHLPRYFTVSYFDTKTGALKRTETFSDEYQQVNQVWFPWSRKVFRAENGEVITRIVEFHNPKIRFKS